MRSGAEEPDEEKLGLRDDLRIIKIDVLSVNMNAGLHGRARGAQPSSRRRRRSRAAAPSVDSTQPATCCILAGSHSPPDLEMGCPRIFEGLGSTGVFLTLEVRSQFLSVRR